MWEIILICTLLAETCCSVLVQKLKSLTSFCGAVYLNNISGQDSVILRQSRPIDVFPHQYPCDGVPEKSINT